MIFFLLANIVACMLLAWARTQRRPIHLLDPGWAFLIGYFMTYCTRVGLYLIDPELGGTYTSLLDPMVVYEHFASAMLFGMLGLVGFALGDLLFKATSLRFSNHLPTINLEATLRSTLFWIVVTSLLVAGILGLRGYLQETGGYADPVELLTGRKRDDFTASMIGRGHYTFGLYLSVIAWALVCLRWVGRESSVAVGSRLLHVTWFLLTVLLWVAFGARFYIILVVFIPFGLYYALRMHRIRGGSSLRLTRRHLLWITAVILAAAIVAGPFGNFLKGGQSSFRSSFTTGTTAWDGFEFTVLAIYSLDEDQYLWGASYIGDILHSYLPRMFYPDKPERYGIVLVQDRLVPELSYMSGTFPPGILVEAFVNFGYAGVFSVCFLIGFLCQVGYWLLQKNDWFWTLQIVLLLPGLAAFRGFGGTLSGLLLNVSIVATVALACRLLPGPSHSTTLRPAEGPFPQRT